MRRLALPERAPLIGSSVGEAERAFEIFAKGDNLLNLTYADTKRFPPPPWVIDDFVEAARGGGASYTPYRGDPDVRSAVALAVSAFLGVDVDSDSELILTPGTQAALFEALAAIVEDGDRVLLVDPDYLCNERILRFLGATVDHVPLSFGDQEPTLDLEHVERGFRDGARLLLLSHPNNPTGAVLDASTVRRIAMLALEHDALVLIDELYSRLVYDGRSFHHLIAQPGMKERCITLLGPSKTESMSGYRVGVLVGPPEIVTAVEDVQAVTAIRAPAYSQHTLTRWLTADEDFIRERVADYQALRDLTVDRLNAIEGVAVGRAAGTSYLFPHVGEFGMTDLEVAQALLRKASVIVNPGFQFGPRGVGCFRICIAQDERVWAAALDRMVDVLTALGEGRADERLVAQPVGPKGPTVRRTDG